MKTSLPVAVLVIACAGAIQAQDVPRYELYGGGSYFRVHASGAEDGTIVGVPDYTLQQRNLNFGLFGWNVTGTENLNRWFGADLDFSGQYGAPVAPFLCSTATPSAASTCVSRSPALASVNTKLHTFTFGPRFTFHRSGRIVPYAHVLLGAAQVKGSLDHSAVFTPLPTFLPARYSQEDRGFVVAPGFGLDLQVNHRVAVRLLQMDYFMTRFFNQRQDNARVSAGIVFRFAGEP